MRKFDFIVLGAGIIGASTAHALLERGMRVALIDRGEPGCETSYGNAGILESDNYLPLSFPRGAAALIRYASNRAPEAHYHVRHLPKSAPWLMALRNQSADSRKAEFFRIMYPLLSRLVDAHLVLARKTGSESLFRSNGLLRLFRTAKGFAGTQTQLKFADQVETAYRVLDNDEAHALEPDLKLDVHRAVMWPNTHTVSNPGKVSASISEHFAANGGYLARGDAEHLGQFGRGWSIVTEDSTLHAPSAVVCLGPWSMQLLARFGYEFPLASVRGYHTHLQPLGGAALSRPVVDMEKGYLLAPMQQGYRITSAYEFADLETPPTPVQIDRVLPFAREMFPLGDELDTQRWMGARPCFPDTLPLVDEAANHKGLWFNFGHSYMGFSLGPIFGQLLADRLTGKQPEVELGAFSAVRFAA